MSNGTALVPIKQPQSTPETGMTMAELGKTMAASGFFQDTKDAAQAIVKIIAGAELGFGPVASMVGVYIVKGRVTLSANLIGSAIKRSGKYNFRVRRLEDDGCTLEFFEGRESIGVSTFGIADAKKAGLTGNDTYNKFPRNMFYARAMSNGAKWFTPDIFGGPIYTPDELGAEVDAETGEILSAPPAPAPLEAAMQPDAVDARTKRLVARYGELVAEAEAIGLHPEALPENADEATMVRMGTALRGAIAAQQRAGVPA